MQMPNLNRHEKISMVLAAIFAMLAGLLFTSLGGALVHGIIAALAAVFANRKGLFNLDKNVLLTGGVFLFLVMPTITAGIVLAHLASIELYKKIPALKEKVDQSTPTS